MDFEIKGCASVELLMKSVLMDDSEVARLEGKAAAGASLTDEGIEERGAVMTASRDGSDVATFH